jgi:tetratricopeptide (TPR) repeat protein
MIDQPRSRKAARAIAFIIAIAFPAMLRAEDQIPRKVVGGYVSIPGAPLPPVSADSVRGAILIYEPFLAGYRYVGSKQSVARGVGYLATLYASISEYPKAIRLFDEAATLLAEGGATGRDLAWLHNNRGLMELEQGLYGRSLQSLRRALSVMPTTDDGSMLHPRAVVLQNLASALQLFGDVEGSETAYLEALNLLRGMGKEHQASLNATSTNLAFLYNTIGDYSTARQILEEVVQKNLSPTLRFAVLNGLASALAGLKDYSAAEMRLDEALRVSDNGDTQRALVLMNLASCHFHAGDFERAQRVGEEALQKVEEAFGTDSRVAAAAAITLGGTALVRGELIKADTLLTRGRKRLSAAGGDRDLHAHATRNLAIVAQRRGQPDRALALSREAYASLKETFDSILAFGSEAQRLAYRNSAPPYDQLANLGNAPLLAEAVLSMKGAVLESLLVERAVARKSASDEDREQLDRIHVLRVEIMARVASGEGGSDRLQRELKAEETALAKRLSVPAASRTSRPTLDRVQNKLQGDEVLVEIIRFEYLGDNGRLEPWYGAIVIYRDLPPAWLPLSPAGDTDQLITDVIGSFTGRRGAGQLDEQGEEVEIAKEPDVIGPLHELYERLWKPVAAAIPAGTWLVYLSPDSATHFVPWAALLDHESCFLAERWKLALVGSGRDLLRPSSTSPSKTILALAYGLEDLPHTRTEVEDLARRGQENGWQTTVLVGKDASEARLFAQPHPRILHFATHGGLLDATPDHAIESRLSRNPMYRAFLYLGGARTARETWTRGAVRPLSDDGILTAEEVGGLDLGGTWLTVLSACRTGSGDPATGEGVLGLRRGFTLAGTENLLFSQWPIRDDATATFMSEFYARVFRATDLASAFRETQLSELRRWRESDGIATAVHRAGGFTMTR